ncbi:toxin-antitoxin system YwqK family antitoxin [Aureivirga marina]|uniref:toxin-antitoxin system YwqK family antitoxin n=1 Tax=Aureivirga marina TaxID=1182451 RepID=UPI0018CAF16B|nr:hypothetical protein [Aureivirga marina]
MQKLLFYTFLIAAIFSQKSFAQVNQFDKNGKRHGAWKKYYSNNQIRYEGQFNHGKEVGVFLFYDEKSDGKPTIMKKFQENSSIAEVLFFFPTGKLKSEGKMDGKNRIGEWKYYYNDGKRLLSKENYQNGKLDGITTVFDKNGKIIEETIFIAGEKNGIQKKYTDAGKLIEAITFKNNKRNGEASFYGVDGVLVLRGQYLNDKKVGKWIRFKNGKKVGEEFPNKRKERPIKK